MQAFEAKVFSRIPLVGGMTDYPCFYSQHRAESICCAIDKYLHVSVQENGFGGVTIDSKSDLPSGIGMGSSGAFHSALILALAKSRGRRLSKFVVAKLAYDLEMGIEDNATGRQDSVACLFNGISRIRYFPDDSIRVNSIKVPYIWQKKLSDRLLLFDSGVRRRARDSIKDILSLLSGYKSNRFNWLPLPPKSLSESEG
jgi:galactokinase/mevalonate kinase-like predicted kinase